jgi:predicted nucleic acid-binding protein
VSVVDASVFVDALVGAGEMGEAARQAVAAEDVLQVPEIFPSEVASGLRGLLLGGELTGAVARRALTHLGEVHIQRYPIDPFLDRIWELRNTLTVYDAFYVALAESLGTTLVTADRRLAEAAGARCDVTLVTELP